MWKRCPICEILLVIRVDTGTVPGEHVVCICGYYQEHFVDDSSHYKVGDREWIFHYNSDDTITGDFSLEEFNAAIKVACQQWIKTGDRSIK